LKAPVAIFSCPDDYAPYVFGHLQRGGFKVSKRESRVPAVFDYVVSDGVRKAAFIAVKNPTKKVLTLMLSPLSPGWNLRGYFGQKKFAFEVTTWLLNASWDDPPNGLHGAGVVAPLKPPPVVLLGSAALQLPKVNEPNPA
jgi:hypothetical protein